MILPVVYESLWSIFKTIHVFFLVCLCFWWGTGSSVTTGHVEQSEVHFLVWESDVMWLRIEFCTQICNTVMYNCTNWVKPLWGDFPYRLTEIPLPIDLLNDPSTAPNCKVKPIRSRRNSPKQRDCNCHRQFLMQTSFDCLLCCDNLKHTDWWFKIAIGSHFLIYHMSGWWASFAEWFLSF